MAFEIQVMRKRKRIGDREDDDTPDSNQGIFLELCERPSSNAIAAVGIPRVLKAESNEEKAPTQKHSAEIIANTIAELLE